MRKICVCVFLLQAAIATAQSNYTWSSTAATGAMDTAGNWVGSMVPPSGNFLIFNDPSTSYTLTNNLPTFTFATPNGSNANSLLIDQNYVISGGTFMTPPTGGALIYFKPGTSVGELSSTLTLVSPLTINAPVTSPLNSTTLSGTFSGSGNLTFYNGSGIILSGSGSSGFTGTTTVNAGAVLYAGTNNAFFSNSSIALESGGALSLVSPKGVNYSSSIPGFGDGPVTGMIDLGQATLTIGDGNGITISGNILGSPMGGAGLTLSSGALTLTGTNTFQKGGTITVSSGATLTGNSANAFGAQAGATTNFVVDGTLTFGAMMAPSPPFLAGSLSGSGMLDVGTPGINISGGTPSGAPFSGSISGAGGVTVSSSGVLILSGSNSYMGATTLISGGTLVVSSSGAIPSMSTLTFPTSSGGTLQAGVDGITLAGATITHATAAVFSIPSGDTLTIGPITATASSNIYVEGPGTLLLSGANPINGTCAIFVENGTLEAGSTSLFSTTPLPPLTLIDGGVLNLNSNSNTIGALNGYGSVELGSSATLTISNPTTSSAYYGTFSGSGSINLSSSGTNYATFMNDATDYTGISFTVPSGATLNAVSLGSASGLTLGSTGVATGGTIFLGSGTSGSPLVLPAITIPSSTNGTVYPNSYTIQLGAVSGGSDSTLNVFGPGTTILGGTLSSVGTLALQGGTLNVGASSLPATVGIQLGFFGASLQAGADLTLTSDQTITVEAGLNDNFATPITFDANSYASSLAGLINGGGVVSVFYLTDTSEAGGGKLTLTNTSNSWTGPTSILNGTLNAVQGAIPNTHQLVFGGALQPTGSHPIFQCGGAYSFAGSVVVMTQGGEFDLNTYDMSISGILAGNSLATLTVTDSVTSTTPYKTLTLSNAANIFQGTIAVNKATLIADSTQAFGPMSTINLGGVTGQLSLNTFSNTIGSLEGEGLGVNLGTGTLTISNGNGYTFSGPITGMSGCGLTLSAGSLTLSGSNSYSGTTEIVSGASLIAGSTSALSPNSPFAVEGTLSLGSNNNTIGGLTGTGGTGIVNLGTAALTIEGSGTQNFTGNLNGTTGSLVLSGSQTLNVSGTSSYSGATTIGASSTLEASSATALAPTSAFSIAGTLNVTESNTVGSISGDGGITVASEAILTIASGAGNTFSGDITSSGGIALTAGTLTLSGTNDYSGPTQVNGGTLIASNGNTSPFGTNSAIAVASGTTLNFGAVASTGIPLGSTATLSNSGTVMGNLSSVTGNGVSLDTYTQVGSNSTLSLALPGTPGMSFIGFNASGDVDLAGALTVTGLAPPTMGQQIILLQGASLSGTFASSNIPNHYTLMYSSTEAYLEGGESSSTFYWTGAMNNLMGTGANWLGASAPSSGDAISFQDSNAPSGHRTAINDISTYMLSAAGQALAVDSGFTIGGMAFTVTPGGALLNLAGSTSTVSTISNNFVLDGIATIDAAGSNIPVLSGEFSGDGGITLSSGSVILQNGSNSYSGTTMIGSGATLYAGIANAFSTSSAMTLSSGGTLSLVSGGVSYSCSLPSLSGGDSTSLVNLGSATLTIVNPGTITLPATFTAAGGTLALSAGTLNLTGSSPGFSSQASSATVSVSSGAIVNTSAAAFGSVSSGAYVNLSIGGTINLTSAGNLVVNDLTGSGTFNIGSNTITTAGTGTFSGTIAGSGGNLAVEGGVLTLTGSNDWTGSTTISNGTLNAIPAAVAGTPHLIFDGTGSPIFQLGANFPAFTPTLTMTSSGEIDLDGYTMVASGTLSGSADSTLTITDSTMSSKSLTLSGTNSFPGTIEVEYVNLTAGSTQAFGTAMTAPTINIGTGGTLTLGSNSNVIGSLTGGGLGVNLGTALLTINNGNGNTFSGAIIGASGKLLLSAGTLTLSGSNSYGGTTEVLGTLVAGSTGGLSDNSTFVLNTGGTLSLGANNSTVGGLSGSGGTLNLGTATLTINNGGGNEFTGSIAGTGSAGLTLAASSGVQILNGTTVSYPGTTTINTGSTLQAGSTSSLSTASSFVIDGILSLMGFSNTVGSISGSGSITLGSGILTIANGNGNTFSGPITNDSGGGITLSSGTLTLSQSNSYTGPTTVNGGTLIASDGNPMPFGSGSAITVGTAGTLEFGTVNAAGVSIGSLSNLGIVTADLSSVTATDGITLSGTAGYTQLGNATLTLNLASDPGASFIPINIPNGPITLGTGVGSLTVTGLAPAMGSGHTVVLMQGATQTGSFASATLPTNYTVQYNDGTVFLVGGGSSMVCSASWNFPGSANWDVTTDWTSSGGGNCVPGINAPTQIHDIATLPDFAGAGNITILLASRDGSTSQDISLYNLNFTAATASYTIQSYLSSLDPLTYSTITLDGSVSPKPNITVTQGSHSIYAPILLNKDSRFSLSGTLTMGIFSSVSDGSQASTLYISEGASSGTLITEGPIFPSYVNIEGCTVDTLSSLTPTVSLTVAGRAGNTAALTLNNYSLVSAPTITIDGSISSTIVNNIGPGTPLLGFGDIFTSSGSFTITTATVTNTLGGQIGAAEGQTLTITSSEIVNDAASIFGLANSNINFVSGTLESAGLVYADNYTQASGATLQIDVTNQSNAGLLSILGDGALGGNLVVNALPGFPTLGSNQTVTIVADASPFTSEFVSHTFQGFPVSMIPELLISSNQIQLNTVPVSHGHSASSLPRITISATSVHNSLITRKCSQLNRRIPINSNAALAANVLDPEELYVQEDEEMAQTPQEDMALSPELRQKLPRLVRREKAPMTTPWNIYGGPIAAFGHIDTIDTQLGQGYASAGAFAGFDVVLPKSPEGTVAAGIGALLEYRNIWGSGLEDSGTLSINRIHASVYGTILPADLPELYFVWVLGTAYDWDTLIRYTGYKNSVHAKGVTNDAVFDALAGVEFTFDNRLFVKMKDFSLTPLFHVQYALDSIGGYKETGGGMYDSEVPSQIVRSLVTSLGARFDYTLNYSAFNIVLELDAEWQREYYNNSRTIPIVPFNITSAAADTPIYAIHGNGLLVALDAFATTRSGLQFEGNWTFQWTSKAYDSSFFFQAGQEF